MVIDEAEPPMLKPFHSLSHPVGAAVNEPMLYVLPLANSGHEIRLVLDEMVTGAKNENSNVPCESHTLIYLLGLRLIPEASTVGWVAVDELGTVILPAPPPPNPPNPPLLDEPHAANR